MKKFLDLSSWRTALGNLLPSAHGHQGGSRKAAIGSMLIMAFAFVGCDDSSSASAGQNDEPAVESSSSSSGKVTEPAEVASSSSEKAKSSSSDAQSDAKQSSSSEKSGKSSSSVNDVSSSSLNGFDWNLPKEAYLNPDIDYGTMTDERDGQVYKTVKIGDQTWMAENLNFDPGQGGSGDYKYRWSWCYDNKKKNCDVGGRLYTWAAAIDSLKLANDVENPIECGDRKYCDSLPTRIRGVCVEGWHLPSRDEWNDLVMMAVDTANAGRIFKSLTGWVNGGNGTDSLGFSALPVGYYQDNGKYYGAGGISRMWSSQSVNDLFATEMGFNSNSNGFVLNFGVGYKSFAYSVRCVKD